MGPNSVRPVVDPERGQACGGPTVGSGQWLTQNHFWPVEDPEWVRHVEDPEWIRPVEDLE